MSNWFKHNVNARNDDRIQALRMSHGIEGYGFYFFLIEMMHENMESFIPESKLTIIFECSGTDTSRCEDILNRCISLGLLKKDNGNIVCDRASDQIEKRQSISSKRAQIGSKGGSSQAIAKQLLSKRKQTQAEESRVEESRVDKNKYILSPFVDKLNALKIFDTPKIVTEAAQKKYVARRKTFSDEHLIQAFKNLPNEPDKWKLKNNGHRPLSWWLEKDDRIEEMLNLHLKGKTTSTRYFNPQLDGESNN